MHISSVDVTFKRHAQSTIKVRNWHNNKNWDFLLNNDEINNRYFHVLFTEILP